MNKLFLTTLLILAGAFFFAHSASAGVISKPPNNLGLVGYWNFDTNKYSSTTPDMSGNGNTGNLTGMDPATDYVDSNTGLGQALDFDGSNDYVEIVCNKRSANMVRFYFSGQ